LIDDPDGVPREKLEKERIKLIKANGGHAVPEMDEIIENYSAEKIAEDNALNFDIEREKRLMEYGLFDEAKMKTYPPSVQAKLKAYQSQLPNYQKNSSKVAADKLTIENQVNLEGSNLPDGRKAKGTDLLKQELNTVYEGNLQAGHSPDVSLEKTLKHLKDRLETEGFKTEEGFVGMFRSAEAILADTTNIDSRLRYGKGKWQSLGKDTESVLQTKNSLYSDEMLKIKVNQLRLGKAQFDEYDVQMAALLGYTHPATMFVDILDRNPIIVNGEPLMFEPPPILELAENLETPEQTRLFNSDVMSARRAISMQQTSTNLPVRGAANYSLADNISEGWGKMSRVIRFAEGTAGGQGYNTMFTGSQFSDNGSHPRQINTSGEYRSDAAGAYQFLSTTWDGAAKALGLKDFSPESQEKAGRYLTQQRQVNPDQIYKTKEEFAQALAKLSPEWASLPNQYGVSYYGQPVKKLDELWNIYNQ